MLQTKDVCTGNVIDKSCVHRKCYRQKLYPQEMKNTLSLFLNIVPFTKKKCYNHTCHRWQYDVRQWVCDLHVRVQTHSEYVIIFACPLQQWLYCYCVRTLCVWLWFRWFAFHGRYTLLKNVAQIEHNSHSQHCIAWRLGDWQRYHAQCMAAQQWTYRPVEYISSLYTIQYMYIAVQYIYLFISDTVKM
jgi:hypothetical protein